MPSNSNTTPTTNLIVDFPQLEDNNLIVGFPEDRESLSADTDVMRKVQFSTRSVMFFYDPQGQDSADNNKKMWYSDDEYNEMRSEFKRTLQKAQETYRCSLSQMDPMRVHNMNRVRAVLDEQERQDRSGVYDSDRLASVSQRYSQWSRIRAKIHIERFI
jgi:hypothetical protein